MIKLIVSDIDGTLLEDGGNELNPELFSVILKLREQGMQFAAATGRQWLSIERVFDPIKEKIFYLSDNGAYVGCHGRNLYLNTVDTGLARQMIRDIQKAGLMVMLSGQDTVYMDEKDVELYDWMVNGYRYQAKKVKDLMTVEDRFIKVSAYRKTDIEPATGSIAGKI